MRWSEEGGGGQARMKEHLFCFGGFRSSYRCNRIRTFNEQHRCGARAHAFARCVVHRNASASVVLTTLYPLRLLPAVVFRANR